VTILLIGLALVKLKSPPLFDQIVIGAQIFFLMLLPDQAEKA
jgi:hypothetical protein